MVGSNNRHDKWKIFTAVMVVGDSNVGFHVRYSTVFACLVSFGNDIWQWNEISRGDVSCQ